MLSDTMRKLNRISRIIGMLAKFMMVILAIGIVIAFVIMVVAIQNPGIISDEFVPMTSGDIAAICATAIFGGCFWLFHLYYINHFFMSIHNNNTPFTDECVRDLNILAVLVVAFAITLPLVGAASSYFIGDSEYLNLGFVFDPFTLFIAFLIYVMALVFKYGTALQRESDETL